jgi:hypothetical protein
METYWCNFGLIVYVIFKINYLREDSILFLKILKGNPRRFGFKYKCQGEAVTLKRFTVTEEKELEDITLKQKPPSLKLIGAEAYISKVIQST